MRLLICGGGTGGHIYPALAAVAELQSARPETQILWLGTRGEMEERLVPRAGVTLKSLRGGAIVGVPVWKRLINGSKLGYSMLTAERIFAEYQPDALFMTGGYINVPVGLVARRRRVPAGIYLPDVEPGAAIRFLSRMVLKVACTTDGSAPFFAPGQTVVTGYPVRPSLREALQLSPAEALALFDLEPGRKTLFVFGGSRGARTINRALQAILADLLAEYQVIHISGELDWTEAQAFRQQLTETQRRGYRVYPYLHEEMGAAFRAADLVVARAGASMLGESPAFALPAILVPYPYAWRYQKVNADYLAERGAAVRLNDELMSTELLPTIRSILNDEPRRQQMVAAARLLDRPDAARNLAEFIERLPATVRHKVA